MAISVMNWVWQHSRAKNGARLVLLAIADACNSDDGTGAWLLMSTLTAKTNLSERAAQTALKDLEALGELRVDRRTGKSHSFAVVMTPADSAGVQNLHPAGNAPPQDVHPTPAESAPTPAESAPITTTEPSDNQDSPPSGESAHAGVRAREATTSSTSNGLHEIPGDFAMSGAMRRWAQQTYPKLDADYETSQFILHQRSTANRRKSWPDAWMKWLGDSNKRLTDRTRRDEARASPGRANGHKPFKNPEDQSVYDEDL